MDDDGDGFVGYVPITVDAGHSIIIVTSIFCLLSQLSLPLCVRWGRQRQIKRKESAGPNVLGSATNHGDESSSIVSYLNHSVHRVVQLESKQRRGQGQQEEGYEVEKVEMVELGTTSNLIVAETLAKLANSSDANYVGSMASPGGKWLDGRTKPGMVDDGTLHRLRSSGFLLSKSPYEKGQMVRSSSFETSSRLSGFAGKARSLVSLAHSSRISDAGSARTSATSMFDVGLKRRTAASRLRGKTALDRERKVHSMAAEEEQSTSQYAPSRYESNAEITVERPPTEVDKDAEIDYGGKPWWKVNFIQDIWDRTLDLFEYDREAKRIIHLAVPLTILEVVESIIPNIVIVLISSHLGTNAVAAWVVVDVVLGITEEFLGGIIDCLTTIGSQAVGAEHHMLAGQYLQIVVVVYSILAVPSYAIWIVYTEDLLIFFGFNAEIVGYGRELLTLRAIGTVIDGMALSYLYLLDVLGHEQFGMFVGIVGEIVYVVLLACALTYLDSSLASAAVIEVVLEIVFLIGVVVFTIWVGWMDECLKGIFGWGALTNTRALATVGRVSLPLCLGGVLITAEWELLTFFATHMGPAEVAAWATLGFVYESLESTTMSIGDAGEIRVAFHLGRRDAYMAKMAAYKTVLLAVVVGFGSTAIFFIFGEYLVTAMTSDPALQHMISDLIPLIGVGNITMAWGMVCWSIVGAQGRYRLATFVALASSWLVTIPLSAILILWLNLDLKGIIAALVIGYSLTGTLLSYVLLMTDWETVSRDIYRMQGIEMGGDDESSSSSQTESKQRTHSNM